MATGKYVVKRSGPTYGAGVFAPAGWGADWRIYRDSGTATDRREVIIFGDSTTFGSSVDNYSYVQQIRNRAFAAGLTDGGKGIFGWNESQLIYEAPEINGVVDKDGTAPSASHDTLAGQYFQFSAGQAVTLQFRTSAFRLWYVERSASGPFTYAVDGGAPVTVTPATPGEPIDRFVYASGFTPGTTHQVVITNGAGSAWIALAPVNATGVSFHKQATHGASIKTFFHQPPVTGVTGPHLATRYQAPMGLVPTVNAGSPTAADGYVAHNVVDTSKPLAARVRPILAFFDLGFNDFSSQVDTDYTVYTEGIRKFAATCRATGCDGWVSAGNMPVNTKWVTYGAGVYNAMKDQAAAEGLAFVDMWQPFGGSLAWTGGSGDPHLTKVQYVAQANFLWDSLLSV